MLHQLVLGSTNKKDREDGNAPFVFTFPKGHFLVAAHQICQ
jgi:hypothetical protein